MKRKSEPRNKRVSVYLTESEYEMLTACSQIAGMSKGDIMRKGLKLAHERVMEMRNQYK